MSSRDLSVAWLISRLKPRTLMRGYSWWLCCLLWLLLIAPAQAVVELRVAIEENVSRLQVGSSTKALIRNGAGQKVGELEAMEGLYANGNGTGVALAQWSSSQLWIEPTGEGFVWIGDRWYRGRTQLVSQTQGLTAVNHVSLEHYLYSVIGAEMSPSWPLEALKAQAVAARSYALHKTHTSPTRLYDLDDTVTFQVYKGIGTEANTTHQAVNATAGQVMTYNGKIILAVFHSASGGHTENVEDIWSNPLPYLRGVPDYDMGAPVYEWTKYFSRREISKRISGVGNVISMTAERITPRGRVITMNVEGDRGRRSISGNDLRKALGLRSRLFTVSPTAEGFQVNGRGFGHGLGLSQWGAYNLAAQGLNYQQILVYYYQGATLAQLQPQ
ncbi:MAG: SpoIID/LytB domain-containing protein [Symploca sp. SIO2B6]|nr:SpoIID/LytB domain-containing protein [Symploca sp. SIO2B6]